MAGRTRRGLVVCMGKNKKEATKIDISYAFTEAAVLLANASNAAIRKKSVGLMLETSEHWIEFGKILYSLTQEEQEEKPQEQEEQAAFGFGCYDIVKQELQDFYEEDEDEE